MKCNALILACLASGALAGIEEIKQAVGNCGKGIEALDSSLKGFSGNPQPIKDAAAKLVSILKESKAVAEKSDKLSLSDALGLQEPVQGLQASSKELVSHLKLGKPMIEKGGYCKLVRENLGEVNSGSLAFMKAVVEKVPTDAQPIADKLAAPLKQNLEEAAKEFSESNCKDSSGGGSSSAPASSSSAPASSEPASSSAPASSSKESAAPTSSEEAEPSSPASSGYKMPSAPATTPYQPTGTGYPTGSKTTQPPMVTAGAAALAGPAGVLAMAAAALVL
ncbi:hypothetical protein L249_1774 [Ophiocordyceps polyrhachis-furcata BCC 54312]|uniref:Cell wall protein n=1 Tax=Ophiocordyceps polyrhachis-furcata BCC 54312 TaxID=1330021 RepID=A0A367LR10_9HYPO|nr:hypothetical protein L249_1774 [Ophiocordyceps polyrhachis-furcata BCC 54312]